MKIQRRKELILCLILFMVFNCFYLHPNNLKSADDSKFASYRNRNRGGADPASPFPEAIKKLQEYECSTPILNPFDPDMVRMFSTNESVDCSNQSQKYYFKAEGTMANEDNYTFYTQEILMMEALPKTMRCCFSTLRFKEQDPYDLIKDEESTTCKFIKLQKTKVPDDSQFVLIKCWHDVATEINPISNPNTSLISPPLANPTNQNSTIKFSHNEILIFFAKPPKNLVRRKARLLQQVKSTRHPKLNVIIVGFDRVSRMSFIRQMDHSFKYLKSTLKAIDLHGYNKIGDATLNNTLAFLTGYNYGAVRRNSDWWNPNSTYFDKLPWIWKNFSDLGYITSMADDRTSIYDYKFKGFRTKPTDYYIHPLIKWHRDPFPLCFGRELKLDIMQNYAKKAAGALHDHPYFQFEWNTAVAIHPTSAYESMADNGILSMLQHFETNGVFNKSLVIILSDHGFRAGPVMDFTQARIENKMPFAFLLLPKWFHELYPKAYENLQENQYRLTTPYDIHSTLEDMLNPEANLNDDAISNQSLNQHRFGISLFRQIPKNRTCEGAGIDEVWCACSSYTDIPYNGTEARKLASFAVDTINSWLKVFKLCSQYALKHVSKAEVKTISHNFKSMDLSGRNTFRIILTVAASKKKNPPPKFEVVVFTESGWLETSRDFDVESKFMKMSTEVFRLSGFGSTPCMTIYALEKICTCR